MSKYILNLICVVFLLSCSHDNMSERLEEIGLYVFTSPDSAMKELRKFNDIDLNSEKLRAYHALLMCESEYFSAHKLNDSILDIATRYFFTHNTCSSKYWETVLFSSYKDIYNEPARALTALLELEKNIDELSTPYLKCVLESFILIIYFNNHEYYKMLEHAYKELNFAYETNETERIVNSKNHVGIAYEKLGRIDSAYVYYITFKDYVNELDSSTLAISYYNLAILLRKMDSSDRVTIKNALMSSLNLSKNSYDKARTCIQLADYFYRVNDEKLADSFTTVFHKYARENDYGSYYNVAEAQNRYYEKIGEVDSANKYKEKMLKYAWLRDSLIKANHVMDITYKNDIIEIEKNSNNKLVIILVVFIVILSGMSWIIFDYKIKRKQLVNEYAINVRKLDDTIVELECVKDRYMELQEKVEGSIIDSHNSEKDEDFEIMHLRYEIKNLTERYEKLNVLTNSLCKKILDMLFKNKGHDFVVKEMLTDGMYPVMNEAYRDRKKGQSFIKDMSVNCEGLSARELFICILYYEGITDDWIIADLLNVTGSTFRTTKSRLRKKLEHANNSVFAVNVLKRMLENSHRTCE